jgi:tetratricopeptide (TPR) repeat protein
MLLNYLKTKYGHELEEGWAAFEIGNLGKAEEHFREILNNEDSSHNPISCLIEAHDGLGAINLKHKDLFEAHRWYTEAYYLLDQLYKGTWPTSLSWRKLEDRGALRTLIGLGHLAYLKKDHIRARSLYNRLLKLDHRDELGVRRFLDALDSGIPFEDLEFF